MVDESKIKELIIHLKERKNGAYQFFEKILKELDVSQTQRDALNRLASCYSMVQYADFDFYEEQLLEEIIASIKK